MKILVLGSNGFIGRNIVEDLSANPSYQMLCPKRQELNLLDTQAVEQYLSAHRPDVVIMSAVNIAQLDQNLVMYFNVERCSHLFGRMITIGSGAEYDMKNYVPMMTEDYFRQHIPSDIYGLSKFVVSNDVERAPRNIINLRVLGIFGKYEDYTRRLISNNICRALAGLGISINQDMKFDFIYVHDFIRTLEKFFSADVKYRNYNVCAGTPDSLLNIAQIICDVHGQGETVTVKEPGEKPEYSASTERLTQEFGPQDLTDMRTCVQELYTWYAHHPDLDDMLSKIKENG